MVIFGWRIVGLSFEIWLRCELINQLGMCFNYKVSEEFIFCVKELYLNKGNAYQEWNYGLQLVNCLL